MEVGKRCVVVCAHDDWWFIRRSIEAAKAFGPVLAFVSRLAWNGSKGDFEPTLKEAESAGAEIILGDWSNETEHRREAYRIARERGYRYAVIPDSDEVIEPSLLQTLIHLADTGIVERVCAHMDTYWKSARYVIRPREQLAPTILIDLEKVEHVYIRDFKGGRAITLGPEHGVIHHLSYAGPDERIQRKITTWSHKHELVQDWYRNAWLAWDKDKTLRNFHPTHPQAYGVAERIEILEILEGIWDERPVANNHPEKPKNWPTVSIVIPLYGGEEDIRMCLESLKSSSDLIHEIIVVNDASPDNAAEVAKEFGVKLLHNETNQGFGETCNKGFELSDGEVILFLNSDTVVPRTGLLRLMEGLMESDQIGAAGPTSNNVGYHQKVDVTYSSPDNIDLFAADFSARTNEDKDVDMLVGFCLAVRRSALLELNSPPFDVRFGRGLFEDTDLCLRLQLLGYRLRLCSRAFVHHEGSKSLERMDEEPGALLARNQTIYEHKWRSEVRSGYIGHLPGLIRPFTGPVKIDPSRHPDIRRQARQELKTKANITLAMIVRDEERVLGDCLASVEGIFNQIVVVDTGSTDRTKEIAMEWGCEVYVFPWTESFSEARNESLKYAKGNWIFWLDADDTLPEEAAERILSTAINAEMDAYVVPVQFVGSDSSVGTRVDHVKLFRNNPEFRFEGRIHEQILPSIRSCGGKVARIEEAVVLHSGYDTSEAGQEKKRRRDERLLLLDLADRPNHPFVLFNLGMTSHYLGDHDSAISWLKKSISVACPTESHVRKAFALLGTSIRAVDGHEAAVRILEKGLQIVGADPELLFLKGVSLYDVGQFEESRQAYLTMPENEGTWFSSVDIGIYGPKRAHNLGVSCFACGRYLEARSWFEKAIELAPKLVHSAIALFDAASEVGDPIGMRNAIKAIHQAEGSSETMQQMLVRMEEVLSGSSVRSHEVDELQLAKHMLEEGDEQGAEPLLRKLMERGSPEASFYLGVMNIRQGELQLAHYHMRRSLACNPGHYQTVEQLTKLEQLLETTQCGELPKGPHLGQLKPPTIRFSVVIVTYNSAQTIGICLESVLNTLGDSGEVIVVDNASYDETRTIVHGFAQHDQRITLLEQSENLGYSKGANIGLLSAQGQFLVLLNPDTQVYADWLERLAMRMTSGVDAVGPVSDNVSGDQYVGGLLPEGVRPPVAALPEWLHANLNGQTLDTRFLVGFCLMIRREFLDENGLLDEEMMLGADDLEISWRIHLSGGRLAVALDTFVRHFGSVSFASLDGDIAKSLVSKSDFALLKKLRRYYGFGKVPSSRDLWGCDIFQPFLFEFGESIELRSVNMI